MGSLKNMSGTLNTNAYEDKGKFVEDTNFAEIINQDAELVDDDNGNWPDFKGKAMIDGREYYISGWYKPDYDFVSLAFKSVDGDKKPNKGSGKKKTPSKK